MSRSEARDTGRPTSAMRQSGSGSKRKAEIPAEDSDDESGNKPEKKARGGHWVGAGTKGRGGKSGAGDHKDDKREKRDRPGKTAPKAGKMETAPKAPLEGEKRGLEKLGSYLGSLIGRKRKARKG